MVERIKGQEVELRHILMMPKVSDKALKEAKEKIITIKKKIESGEITFSEAARTLSDEKETRANGGILINPKTQDTHFELTKMDPSLYSEVSNLKDNAITPPILDDDPRTGKKYKIITVTNRINEHPADYAKDYIKIKDLALKEKQIKAIAKWSDEKIKETLRSDFKETMSCEEGIIFALKIFKEILGKNFDLNRFEVAYVKIGDEKLKRIEGDALKKYSK
jgi:peptidyl-prolyl cis-trans isomerase SurA